jgi:hypothetical protein
MALNAGLNPLIHLLARKRYNAARQIFVICTLKDRCCFVINKNCFVFKKMEATCG